VMDSTAVSLSMENNLPIVVVNFWQPNSVKHLVQGETIGTTICKV
jgi:uridylate kinase